MRQALSVVGLVCALTTGAATQLRRPPPLPPDPAPTPQFKTSVDVVHLDVSVLDRNRRPVRGLKPSDFTILEDGKPQEVAVFGAVDVPDVEVHATPWMREIALDVRSNSDVQEQRLFLLILDDATIQAQLQALQTVREIARKVIDGFGPTDLAAVVFTRDNRNAQDFTTDRARLLKAVDTFSAGFRDMGLWDAEMQKVPPGQDDGYFLFSINVVENAVEALSSLPDRRKSIVYIGQGMPVDLESRGAPEIDAAGLAGQRAQQYLADMRGTMSGETAARVRVQIERVFQRAARANVTLYTLDACGQRTPPPASRYVNPRPTCVAGLETEYLKTLAAATGGRAVTDTNDFDPGIQAIFEENASYYLLGFTPNGPRQDGKFRRLEVRVDRPGVTVRTRNGYQSERRQDAERRKAALAHSPAGVALAGILPKSDLPLQVVAAPFLIPGKKESAVAIAVGVKQPIRQNAARAIERVDLLVSAFGVEGKPQGSRRLTADVAIRAGASGLAEYEVLSRIDLKPGRYQLRIGANAGSLSTSGSVYADVDVPDFGKPAVSLSGVVLNVTPSLEVAPRDVLNAIVPILPTTRRTFTPGQHVSAFVRMYQGGNAPVTAVPLRVQLIDANGASVMDRRQEIAPAQFDGARAADIGIPVPVERLAAGEYLLSLDCELKGAATRRDVRFRVTR